MSVLNPSTYGYIGAFGAPGHPWRNSSRPDYGDHLDSPTVRNRKSSSETSTRSLAGRSRILQTGQHLFARITRKKHGLDGKNSRGHRKDQSVPLATQAISNDRLANRLESATSRLEVAVEELQNLVGDK